MRYFKPGGTLNDVSSGTLTGGEVPIERLFDYTETDTLSGDTALGTGPTTLFTLAPTGTAIGDLWLIEVRLTLNTAGSGKTCTISFAETGTLLDIRVLNDDTDLALWTPAFYVYFGVEWELACFVEMYVAGMTAFTDIDVRAQTSATVMTCRSGSYATLRRYARD